MTGLDKKMAGMLKGVKFQLRIGGDGAHVSRWKVRASTCIPLDKRRSFEASLAQEKESLIKLRGKIERALKGDVSMEIYQDLRGEWSSLYSSRSKLLEDIADRALGV